MTPRRLQYMASLASQVALGSTMRDRVGAVLAQGKRVVGVGCNQAKTHPLLRRHHYPAWSGVHAEMAACLGVDHAKLAGSSLYVVRVKREGGWGLSRPCPRCQAFLEWCGVRRVWWSSGRGEEVVS